MPNIDDLITSMQELGSEITKTISIHFPDVGSMGRAPFLHMGNGQPPSLELSAVKSDRRFYESVQRSAVSCQVRSEIS
jgi:hypothetical protein